jgi:hypothetical protein
VKIGNALPEAALAARHLSGAVLVALGSHGFRTGGAGQGDGRRFALGFRFHGHGTFLTQENFNLTALATQDVWRMTN